MGILVIITVTVLFKVYLLSVIIINSVCKWFLDFPIATYVTQYNTLLK